MLSVVLAAVQIAAYLVFDRVVARKYQSTCDRGLLWLRVGFPVVLAVVLMAQAWCTLVFWVRSPHEAQITAVFEATRSIVQMLALIFAVYMLGGKPQERNLFKWLFEENNQPGSAIPPHSI